MSYIYEELKDVTVLCEMSVYKYIKEYIDNIFPDRPILLWNVMLFNELELEDNKHYLSIMYVPYIYGDAIRFIPGTWRYSPIISKKDVIEIYEGTSVRDTFVNIDPSQQNVPYNIPVFPKGCKVSFLNIEHLTDKYSLEYIQRKLSDKIDLYHHSPASVRIMGRGKCIPYRITDAETEKLKRYLGAYKKYDVCVVGNCSRRRKYIVNELFKKMITVLTIGEISKCTGLNDKYAMHGDERDAHIGEARILLNIHLRPCWTVYESIRCDRWAAAGMPIISETSVAPGAPPGVIECSYDDIVTTVVRELAKLK